MLVINLLLALVWGMLQGAESALDYLVGFLLGFMILAILRREYGRRTIAIFDYTIFLIGQIMHGALDVAWAIVGPRRLSPGIVAVPLWELSEAEMLVLVSSITLTPGTISVETGSTLEGEHVLFVHVLFLEDPDAVRVAIRENFERRIVRFTRSADDFVPE
jgi:multicomponent Na+:H+ antiporter subunit E